MKIQNMFVVSSAKKDPKVKKTAIYFHCDGCGYIGSKSELMYTGFRRLFDKLFE